LDCFIFIFMGYVIVVIVIIDVLELIVRVAPALLNFVHHLFREKPRIPGKSGGYIVVVGVNVGEW